MIKLYFDGYIVYFDNLIDYKNINTIHTYITTVITVKVLLLSIW